MFKSFVLPFLQNQYTPFLFYFSSISISTALTLLGKRYTIFSYLCIIHFPKELYMRITIRDVAEKAGVSVSTVSKVINGWTTISAETTARVNAVIQELNFIPNARAVSFARKATKNIVFLSSLKREEAYKSPHMFDIMCGAYKEVSARHYTMTLMDTSGEKYPGETVDEIISAGAADAIIVHGTALNEKVAEELLSKNFPHTVIGNPGFDTQLCWIDTNHVLGGQFAAEHLISCGYTRVGYVGGRRSDPISLQRLKGLRQTMLKKGYRIASEHIIYTDSGMHSAYNATLQLIESKNLPQAIVCGSNTTALGVTRAIAHSGLSVPDDVAFVVFDRYPYTDIIEPSPTIIDIDMYDIGRQAAITVSRKLENPEILVQSFTTLPILVQGKSTFTLK